jgi:hypothetical protein
VRKVRQVWKVRLAQEAYADSPDLQEMMVIPVRKAQPVSKAHKAQRVWKVRLAQEAYADSPDLQEMMVLQDHRVRKA